MAAKHSPQNKIFASLKKEYQTLTQYRASQNNNMTTDNMNKTESAKYGYSPNYMKANRFQARNLELHLTLSELRN